MENSQVKARLILHSIIDILWLVSLRYKSLSAWLPLVYGIWTEELYARKMANATSLLQIIPMKASSPSTPISISLNGRALSQSGAYKSACC
jgi:hypothetical protein